MYTRKFFIRVYMWLAIALLTSTISSLGVAFIPNLRNIILVHQMLPLGIMFVVLGLIIFMAARVKESSPKVVGIIFIVISVLMGISLSTVFIAYNLGTITLAFFLAVVMYTLLALFGYFTKIDLSPIATFLFLH